MSRLVRAALVVSFVVLFTVPYGCGPKPPSAQSLVERIQKRTVSASDVVQLEFLRFYVNRGWPFSEEEYATMQVRSTNKQAVIKEFVQLLKGATSPRTPEDTHLISEYFGIVRVTLKDGAHYYVYYELMREKKRFVAYLSANIENSANPNDATHYRSVPFADFLRRNDPWYRTPGEEERAEGQEDRTSK